MKKPFESNSLTCECSYVQGGKDSETDKKHANALRCKCEKYSKGKLKGKEKFSDIFIGEER